MSDFHSAPGGPHNWSQAFAALPLEAPDASAWPALAAAQHATRAPVYRRRQARWAAAAALALAIAVPVAWLQDRLDVDAVADGGAVARHGEATVPGSKPSAGSDGDTAAAVVATAETAAGPRPDSPAAPGALAATSAASAASEVGNAAASNPTLVSDATAMPALYARSAQLEAMLARVRDERVASGPAAALSLQYESQVALVDARLSEASLQEAQRVALWRDRVDALQQLVDFESTQRWLSVQGERYDGQLVAVY